MSGNSSIAPHVPGGSGWCGRAFAADGLSGNARRAGRQRRAAGDGGADCAGPGDGAAGGRRGAAAAATAAPAAAPGASGAPKRGGQATILQTNDFVSMDPIFASGPTASAVYDWLLEWRKNPDGSYAVQPGLARAWETSADKIVFHLRDGVKFHDGSDLNADVVVWNLNRMVQNPKSFAKNYMLAVDAKTPRWPSIR